MKSISNVEKMIKEAQKVADRRFLIPASQVYPGYYWASYGYYEPSIVQVLWQRKPGTHMNGIGKYKKGGELRPPESYQDLCAVYPGLTDRILVNSGKLLFHMRIPDWVEPNGQ